MKNKMILTTILLLSCAITGIYAAAPGGTGAAEAGSLSEETMRSLLEDKWLLHSQPQLQDQIAQQLTRDWIRAGRNPRPSLEEVAQHFGGEGGLFTPAILEKVRRNLILSGPVEFIELPLSKAYQGDYESFRDDLIAYLDDRLTGIGAHHGVSLRLSNMNLGELVRNNPGQCVDLMQTINDTINGHQCIVTQLDLSDNGLTTLPEDAFGQFDNLQWLFLRGNQLVTLPAGIFAGLTNLRFLWLHNNQLATLPPDIFAGLINLQGLYLFGNQLVTLPAGIFGGLTNLQELRFSNNQLTTLPAGIFAGLTNLQALWLDENQLTTLPPGIFAGLTNLQRLRLNNNHLATLPAHIFGGLTNLQELRLAENQLATLPAGIFAGLTNLQRLRLNHNQLTTLPAGIFAGLTRLQELWLNNNKLTNLPLGIFADLTNLKILSLFGNQLPPEEQEAIRRELPATTKITF